MPCGEPRKGLEKDILVHLRGFGAGSFINAVLEVGSIITIAILNVRESKSDAFHRMLILFCPSHVPRHAQQSQKYCFFTQNSPILLIYSIVRGCKPNKRQLLAWREHP